MAVTSLTPGELFTVRIYKRLVTNPALVWANSYELRRSGPLATVGGEQLLLEAGNVLVDFEQLFHLPSVRFDRFVISTLVEDGETYNPASFISVPVANKVGASGTDGSGPEPLTSCLLVRRQVPYGRSGRALYRGALQDSETTSESGTMALTTAALNTIGTKISGNVEELIAALAVTGFTLVMVGKVNPDGGRDVRDVVGMEVAGATSKQLNNRYFDRA